MDQDTKGSSKQRDLFSEIIHDTEERKSYQAGGQKGSNPKSLNLDKILLFLLICAMIFAVVFSYGIETGKRMSEDSKSSSVEEPRSRRSSVVELKALSKKKLEQASAKELDTVIPLAAPSQAKTTSSAAPASEQAVLAAKPEVKSEPKKKVLPPEYWTVQIITYVNQAYANEEIRKFKKQGYEAFIIPSGKYLQVCIGKYNTRDEAMKVLAKFKKQKDYADSYLRKVKRK